MNSKSIKIISDSGVTVSGKSLSLLESPVDKLAECGCKSHEFVCDQHCKKPDSFLQDRGQKGKLCKFRNDVSNSWDHQASAKLQENFLDLQGMQPYSRKEFPKLRFKQSVECPMYRHCDASPQVCGDHLLKNGMERETSVSSKKSVHCFEPYKINPGIANSTVVSYHTRCRSIILDRVYWFTEGYFYSKHESVFVPIDQTNKNFCHSLRVFDFFKGCVSYVDPMFYQNPRIKFDHKIPDTKKKGSYKNFVKSIFVLYLGNSEMVECNYNFVKSKLRSMGSNSYAQTMLRYFNAYLFDCGYTIEQIDRQFKARSQILGFDYPSVVYSWVTNQGKDFFLSLINGAKEALNVFMTWLKDATNHVLTALGLNLLSYDNLLSRIIKVMLIASIIFILVTVWKVSMTVLQFMGHLLSSVIDFNMNILSYLHNEKAEAHIVGMSFMFWLISLLVAGFDPKATTVSKMSSLRGMSNSVEGLWNSVREIIDEILFQTTGHYYFQELLNGGLIQDFVRDSMNLLSDVDVRDKVRKQEIYAKRAIDLYQKCLKYRLSKSLEPNEIAQMNLILMKLEPLYFSAIESSTLYHSRVMPVVLSMTGPPKQGKSLVTTLMIAAVHKLMVDKGSEYAALFDHNESLKFTRTPESEYWSGYKGQFACVYNEMFAQNDPHMRGQMAAEFLRVVGTEACPLNMAAVNEKGGTHFASRFIVCNTNFNDWDNIPLCDVGALTRRMHYYVEVEKTADLNIDTLENIDLAWKFKIPQGSYYDRYFKIHNRVSNTVTFSELAKLITDDMLKNERRGDPEHKAFTYDWSSVVTKAKPQAQMLGRFKEYFHAKKEEVSNYIDPLRDHLSLDELEEWKREVERLAKEKGYQMVSENLDAKTLSEMLQLLARRREEKKAEKQKWKRFREKFFANGEYQIPKEAAYSPAFGQLLRSLQTKFLRGVCLLIENYVSVGVIAVNVIVSAMAIYGLYRHFSKVKVENNAYDDYVENEGSDADRVVCESLSKNPFHKRYQTRSKAYYRAEFQGKTSAMTSALESLTFSLDRILSNYLHLKVSHGTDEADVFCLFINDSEVVFNTHSLLYFRQYQLDSSSFLEEANFIVFQEGIPVTLEKIHDPCIQGDLVRLKCKPIKGLKNLHRYFYSSAMAKLDAPMCLARKSSYKDAKVVCLAGETAILQDRPIQADFRDSEATIHSVVLNKHYRVVKGKGIAGLCGSPWIIIADGQIKIIGLHSARIGEDALVSPLIQDMFITQAQIGFTNKLSKEVKGTIPYFKVDQSMSLSSKSSFAETCLKTSIEEILETKSKPADLSWDAYENCLAKYSNFPNNAPTKEAMMLLENPALQKQVFNDFLGEDWWVTPKLSGISAKTISFNEALELLEKDTSSGYPYKFEGIPKRGNFLTEPYKSRLESDVNELLNNWELGIYEPQVIVDQLKDELRALDRVALKKTRLFQVGSVSQCVAQMMIVGHLYTLIKEQREKSFCAIGINPYGPEIGLFCEKMFRYAPNRDRVVGGDLQGMDFSTPSWMGILFAKFLEYYGVPVALAKGLVFSMINSIHICPDGSSYVTDHGNSSGNFSTAIYNTFSSFIYYTCACMHLTGRHVLSDVFSGYFYGDDEMGSVKESYETQFNNINITQYYSSMGLVRTNPSKGEFTQPFLKEEEQSFLSRIFVRSNSRIFFLLEEDSVLAKLAYAPAKYKCDFDYFEGYMRGALYELTLYELSNRPFKGRPVSTIWKQLRKIFLDNFPEKEKQIRILFMKEQYRERSIQDLSGEALLLRF